MVLARLGEVFYITMKTRVNNVNSQDKSNKTHQFSIIAYNYQTINSCMHELNARNMVRMKIEFWVCLLIFQVDMMASHGK